jgi:hypothetical protein
MPWLSGRSRPARDGARYRHRRTRPFIASHARGSIAGASGRGGVALDGDEHRHSRRARPAVHDCMTLSKATGDEPLELGALPSNPRHPAVALGYPRSHRESKRTCSPPDRQRSGLPPLRLGRSLRRRSKRAVTGLARRSEPPRRCVDRDSQPELALAITDGSPAANRLPSSSGTPSDGSETSSGAQADKPWPMPIAPRSSST